MAPNKHIELEIGCGHGDFLLQMGRENSDNQYIGIDINQMNCEISESKIRKSKTGNVLIVHAEAKKFIYQNIPANSVNNIHVYFPSPYLREIQRDNPLGQNIKQWLVSKEFLDELKRIGKDGCQFRFATDHKQYFEHVAKVVELLDLICLPWLSPLKHTKLDELIGSGCERKQRQLGKKIYYLQCVI